MSKSTKSTLILVAFLTLFGANQASVQATAQGVAGSGVQQTLDQVAANKEIARRFLTAIPAKDIETMRSLFAPDAHLVLKLAGIYSPELHAFPGGTQWNRDELIDMEINFQKQLKGPFTLKILSLIGEGDLVTAEVVGQGVRASTGRQYLQHYSYNFQIRNGKIADARLYEDTFHDWDIWANTGPSKPAPNYQDTSAQAAGEGANSVVAESKANDSQVPVNKEAVRRWVNALTRKDATAIIAEFAPDLVWSFAVNGDYLPDQRTFQGAPQWTHETMPKMQTDFQAHLREPEILEIYSIIGEGSAVSVELVGLNVRADGRAYRQHYNIHFKFRDGKAYEGHVYQDTLHMYDLALPHPDGYAPVTSLFRH